MCAGLYGSGSTWAFNAVMQVLRQRPRAMVTSCYADTVGNLAADMNASEQFTASVIKTHLPDLSLVELASRETTSVILSVRDPRDAVVSMMSRFKRSFLESLHQVEQSANRLLYVREHSDALVLKYEDVLLDEESVRLIASFLNTHVPRNLQQRIAHDLSAPVVARHVLTLVERGILKGIEPGQEWEAGTHWHPFHVGDGRVGKYSDMLTNPEIDTVLYRTAPFCRAFGYGHCRSGNQITEIEHAQTPAEGWADSFIAPDLILGWARSGVGGRARVFARHNENVLAQAVANQYRPDLDGLQDGCLGYHLRLGAPLISLAQPNPINIFIGEPDHTIAPVQITFQSPSIA